MSSETPAIEQALVAQNNAEDKKKVFVGNLDYKTTDESLRELFTGHGTVTNSSIIKKFPRSSKTLGYGFVTFSTEEEAAEAISEFDKKEVNGRTINVEIAKPPVHTPRGAIAKEAAEAAGGEQATAGHETSASGRGGRRGRGRRGRGGANRGDRVPADGEAETAQPETNGDTAEGVESADNARGQGRRGRGRGARGRRPRAPRGPPTGEPSKTLLFVANLPFSLDNDGLKNIFTGYNVVNAHVVVRRYGPVTGRSKGFGFVEVSDEAEQKKVLEAFNGKEVEGRELQVKVAVEQPAGAEAGAEQAAESTEAA